MKRVAAIVGIVVLVSFSASLGAIAVYQSRFSQLNWHCSNWEDNWNVTLGHHPAIVLYAEKPATETSDRQVCYATLKGDE